MTRLKLERSISLVLGLTALSGAAQQPDAAAAAKQEKMAALKQSLAQNQAALKQYAWVETTQISLKGEVKKQEQKQCLYGADGKVQKTPVQGASAPPQPQQDQSRGRRRGGGLVKKEIVEHKVGEMKEYMERVAALVHEYAPPDPQKIQAAQAAGNVSVQPGGVTTINIKDYLKPGDSLVLGFDSAAKKIRSYDVQSYLDNPKDDAVKLAVTFASLADGTNYVQRSVLDVPGKKIQVATTNSGHKKAGS